MCGLYGMLSNAGDVLPDQLMRQRDLLAHRGPDDAGFWVSRDGKIGLAHRRLAIVDLSAAGHQPMSSPDGRLTVVFNGEIYNHQELRLDLIKAGHVFRGGSDTEVLLAAWLEWGSACVTRFNGMFAFAIFDAGAAMASPALYLVRDRAGKKPLYYSSNNGRLEFASELKAMSSRGDLNLNALNHYLALGYVPHDLCISEGVQKLPAGHMARIAIGHEELRVSRYWSLPPNNPEPHADGEALADEAARLIEDATRLRLIADVPVGVLLSGGLDSSLVLAAAAHVSSRPIETFTIALPGSSLDESGYARLVAIHFGTTHRELPLAESGIDTLEAFADFVDEPIADSSLLPAFMVSRLTRQHVTVALGGDGGDELFGGYGDYPASLADAERFKNVPPIVLRAVAASAALLPAGVRGRNRLASLSHGPMQQMIWGSPYFDEVLRQRIFSRTALAELGETLAAPELFLVGLFEGGAGPVDKMTRTHFGSILPDDFLVKVDRTSMAASLEMRAPLLDYRLTEFAFEKIPDEWKVNRGETRRIQKILARRWLPSELDVNRKQGFSVPLDSWLRQLPRPWHDTWLDRLPCVLDRCMAASLVDGLYRGRANGARIFALIMLGLSIKNLGS